MPPGSTEPAGSRSSSGSLSRSRGRGSWNDFGGALVLIQKPEAFTVQLALSRFSTLYATDQGLTFAGMAIAILPPLLLFLVLQRSFIRGLTAGAMRR